MHKVSTRSKLKKYLLYILIAFIAVFVLKFCYELFVNNADVYIEHDSSYGAGYAPKMQAEMLSSSAYSVKNVASAKVAQRDITTGQSITIDQKYEKVANIGATSAKFEEDNQKLRDIIKSNEAVIQTEKLSGFGSSQNLIMAIGVMPDNFDNLVEQVKKIGNLRSFNVDKVDKTAEFRQLMAERATLQKTLAAYQEIKTRGGDINELISLERSILEIERTLQNLGVNLGTFADDNSFCTINFSLASETVITYQPAGISLYLVIECLKDSFIWTLTVFIIVTLIVVFFIVCLLIVLLALQKFQKLLPKEEGGQETNAPAIAAKDDKV